MAAAPRKFVVVLRGPSLARIPAGAEFGADNVPSEVGPVKCAFRTYFVNEGFEDPVPRGLYAEVESGAPDVDAAITASINTAMMLKPFLSLSANASVGDLEFEVAFDDTPGSDEHDFVQHHVRAPSGWLQPGRWIATTPTQTLTQAVASHPRFDRRNRPARTVLTLRFSCSSGPSRNEENLQPASLRTVVPAPPLQRVPHGTERRQKVR